MKLNKQKGFSLVELMIVAAGIGLLAVVGMQLTTNMAKTTKKYEIDSESTLITNEIVAILSDPSKCLATLGGKNAISTISTINGIDNTKYFSIAGGSAPANGYGNSNISINSYALKATLSEVNTDKNSWLIINYQNKNILKGTSGPANITKKIKLYVDVDGAKNITFCRSLSSKSTDIWSRGVGAITYYNGGNVGIGTTAPAVALDVNGGIRPGSSGVTIGGACSGEGSFGYDLSTHAPVYCGDLGKWAVIGGRALQQNVCVSVAIHNSSLMQKCPIGYYVAGIKEEGLTTGSKRWYGQILCCLP